jgi:hypothetical protein
MANMELITSVTVGSGGAASVTLPATGTIPATYTDLKVLISSRDSRSNNPYNEVTVSYNGTSGIYSRETIYGTGTSAGSETGANGNWVYSDTTAATASTFSNSELYIPNYIGSTNKIAVGDSATENDSATGALFILSSGVAALTSAITSITLTSNVSNTFAEGSTFYLYGISNVTSTTKATGGIVSSDGTYNYHMFPFSGTFTPTAALTNVNYLVIAGGGGGAATDGNDTQGGGGGGAGGLRSTVTATGGGGSLESTISLNSGTAYTITVGAGGNGGDANTYGTNTTSGSNSSIAGTGLTTITSTGGGRAGNTNSGAGAIGGSGGGGNQDTGTGAAGTANQGYAGANAASNKAGGGGGAGGNATVPAASTGAGSNGGIGVQITAFAYATETGANNGYYAGGGGGNAWTGGVAGLGGLGGGGNGTNAARTGIGQNGIPNTGGGGGGSGNSSSITGAKGGNGGSGLVIIRYAI